MHKAFCSLLPLFLTAFFVIPIAMVGLANHARAATVSGGTIDLPETGQSTCYDAAGTVVDCTNTGQDGHIVAGVSWPSPRFVNNGDGTVTDNLTGLVWLRYANCAGTSSWETALTAVKKLNSTGAMNTTDCGDTSNGGTHQTDWRLPSINELESLVNLEKADPATWLNTQGFSNMQTYYYWSGTSAASQTNKAWWIKMDIGLTNVALMSSTAHVLPVRSSGSSGSVQVPQTGQTSCYNSSGTVDCSGTGQDGELKSGAAWPSPRFTDKGDGSVLDKLTGLAWLKDANCMATYYSTSYTDGSVGDGAVTWQHALDFVAGINSGSYSRCGAEKTDWRLPNRKELLSLVDYSQYLPVFPTGHPFSNYKEDFYWSGSSASVVTSQAWGIYMYGGYATYFDKSDTFYVWPVRSDTNTGSAAPAAPVITVTTSGLTVTISWNSVPGATGYTMLYAPYPSGKSTKSFDVGSKTSYSATLGEGDSYYVAVEAYNAAGKSEYSNIELFMVTTESAVPLAPVLTVTTSGLTVTASWRAPGATGYTLFYAPYPSGEPIKSKDMGSQTSYSVTLSEGGSYYVAVEAYNAAGKSKSSNTEHFTVTATTQAGPR